MDTWAIKTCPFCIVFTALASFALGLGITYDITSNPSIFTLLGRSFKIRHILVQAFAAIADIAITGAICWYLHGHESDFRQTQQLIHTLIIYATSRGVLTAICQILDFFLYTALPFEFIWLNFHQLSAKLYVNSVLMTLNVRKSLKLSHRVPTSSMLNFGGPISSPSPFAGHTRGQPSKV